MKKFTFLAIASLAVAFTPAIAQTDGDPANATNAIDAAPAANTTAIEEDSGNQAALASEKANSDASWGTLDDTTRFLSIMGTADGFSAAGAGSPCFPGKDNNKLDIELKAAGFDSKNPTELAASLAQISSPAEQCAKVPQRGYSTDLLKSMPDDHLAIYITGAVRGYAHIKTCMPEDHAYAAAAIAAELFTVKTATPAHEVIASALANGCAQPAA